MDAHLEPMPADRLTVWLESGQQEYVEERIRAGDTPEQARRSAEASYAQLVTDGNLAPNHHVFEVVVGDEVVGCLWLGPQTAGDLQAWWVWDIEIEAEHRRQGLGRQAMLLAEREVAARGGRTLGLNVFGFNAGARALYESLGYTTAAVRMLKTLDPEG